MAAELFNKAKELLESLPQDHKDRPFIERMYYEALNHLQADSLAQSVKAEFVKSMKSGPRSVIAPYPQFPTLRDLANSSREEEIPVRPMGYEEPSVFSIHQIGAFPLLEGDIVGGISNNEEVLRFCKTALSSLLALGGVDQFYRNNDVSFFHAPGTRIVAGGVPGDLLEQMGRDARDTGFYGKLRDFQAVVTSMSVNEAEWERRRSYLQRRRARTYTPEDDAEFKKLTTNFKLGNAGLLFQAQAYSTGRGEPVGTFSRKAILQADDYTLLPTGKVRTAITGKKETQMQLAALVATSAEARNGAYRLALSRVVNAGLPTLGKRR